MADINKSRELGEEQAKGVTVKVDVDVSEALTGLKALERQAKSATQALRELERVSGDLREPIDYIRESYE